MQFDHKIRLFLNQPGFFKHHLQRSKDHQISKCHSLKTIFPAEAQLQRFSQLQQARQHSAKDSALDNYVQDLIKKFERTASQNQIVDIEIEKKKDVALGKLKIDYVEEQMSQHLEQLKSLIENYAFLTESIDQEKKYIEKVLLYQKKMIMMTQIKRALKIQNQILKKDNEILKKQEEEVDRIIESGKNRKKQ